MSAILTNTWMRAGRNCPPRDREVLVAFDDGTKMTLVWDGHYWCEPRTKIRQIYADGLEPKWWYMFEKLEVDGRC